MPRYDDFLNIPYTSFAKISREYILKHLKKIAPVYASGKLIDIGCGTKPYEPIFAPYVDSYFGVDYAPTAEVVYGSATNADLFADCTKTGIKECSFDTLLSTQVMEHVYDTKAYVDECRRLLKPGGIGIFSIPFSFECHAEPYDYFRFSKYALNRLFTEGGFDILELFEAEGAYAALMQMRLTTFYKFNYVKNWLLRKILYGVCSRAIVPIINIMALKLDTLFWNDKLCLDYMLVVRKR